MPGEMGDKLPVVNLGTGKTGGIGSTAAAIAAGVYHTCALLINGTVKYWGGNSYGELGQGDKIRRGDNADEMGDNLS